MIETKDINSQTFLFTFFHNIAFNNFVALLDEQTFHKTITAQRNLTNPSKILDLEIRYIVGEIEQKAKKLFVEFALEQLPLQTVLSKDVDKEIFLFENAHGKETVCIWDRYKYSYVPKDIIVLNNKKLTTIILDENESYVDVKRKEITFNLVLGFNKDRIQQTNAVKVLKVVA
ncbi:MAG: hypothetical protein ACOCQQ_02015 [Candidatus Nanoarchaeia archaeon]